MAEAKNDRQIVLPKFRDYMHQVLDRPGRTQSEYLLRELKNSHAGFGLRQTQMALLLRLCSDFKLLPFKSKGLTGGIQSGQSLGIVLPGSNLADLAALAYFGLEQMAVTEEKDRSRTLAELFPNVWAAVHYTKTSINRRYRMKAEYPNLGENIDYPSEPENPDKVIPLVAARFDPNSVIESLTSSYSPIAESATRSSLYGKLQKRLTTRFMH
jgi:hypothetical protein